MTNDYSIAIYDAASDGLVTVDARELDESTLRTLRDEAGAAGDLDAVAMLDAVIAGA